MTKIKFFKNHDIYTGFECSGHSGYAEYGKDIVCASISSMTQMTCLGIVQVLNIPAEIVRNDDKGYIKIKLPESIDKSLQDKVQVLINTLKLSLEDLLEGYAKYIKLEVIENVY